MRKDSAENILEWSEKIKKQKLSNLSDSKWCQEQGIPYSTFRYWKKRIEQAINSKKQFIEMPEDRALIEISLRGVRIAISKDFDRCGLIYLLSLLKNESC